MPPILVKVCGLTDASNARACLEAGADWLGLNFHPPSPRSITPDRAATLAAALPPQAELVGLFVDRPITDVAAILCEIPAIRTIQLHGSESVSYLEICRAIPSRPRIIRAFRLQTIADLDAMNAYLRTAADRRASPDAVLVDALVAGQAGGTGQAIPSGLLGSLPDHPSLILAGGLTPSNVAERVQLVRPWMVDVASGVESAPGWKDPQRVAAFVAAARRGMAPGA